LGIHTFGLLGSVLCELRFDGVLGRRILHGRSLGRRVVCEKKKKKGLR
jgi:hypothetical protein